MVQKFCMVDAAPSVNWGFNVFFIHTLFLDDRYVALHLLNHRQTSIRLLGYSPHFLNSEAFRLLRPPPHFLSQCNNQ